MGFSQDFSLHRKRTCAGKKWWIFGSCAFGFLAVALFTMYNVHEVKWIASMWRSVQFAALGTCITTIEHNFAGKIYFTTLMQSTTAMQCTPGPWIAKPNSLLNLHTVSARIRKVSTFARGLVAINFISSHSTGFYLGLCLVKIWFSVFWNLEENFNACFHLRHNLCSAILQFSSHFNGLHRNKTDLDGLVKFSTNWNGNEKLQTSSTR